MTETVIFEPLRPARKTSLGVRAVLWLALALLIHTSAIASTLIFTQDAAGRLQNVNYGGGKSVGYTYDNAGNLLQRQFVIGGLNDSDLDGMDDSWELQYFGDLTRDGTGDFDNDGLSDLSEFFAGTLPNDPSSVLRIIRVVPNPGVGNFLEWTSVPGKRYRVQHKSSLSSAVWLELPGEVEATGATTSTMDNTLSGGLPRFYRIAVSSGAAVVPPPTLSIARTNNLLRISWPSSTPAGYVLESTTNLVSSATWSTVTNAVSDNGTSKSVHMNIDLLNRGRFFRLRQ